jgi:hypothetical protein
MEEKQEKNVEKKTFEKLKEKIENVIDKIIEEDSIVQNIAMLCQLQDIHKNIENEEYWKEKIDNMYNEGSYGRYNEGYNARGVKGTGRYSRYRGGRGSGRYRGEEALDEMKEIYGEYAESSSYGGYGAEGNMELIEMMADSLMDFVEHLKKTAKSPEEKQLIQQKLQELGRM